MDGPHAQTLVRNRFPVAYHLRNRVARSSESGAWNQGKMHRFKPSHTEWESRKVRPLDEHGKWQYKTEKSWHITRHHPEIFDVLVVISESEMAPAK